MTLVLYLDTLLVPLSLFLTLGYHALLWRIFKNKPLQTAVGAHAMRIRAWLEDMKQGDDKKGMLAVQSLRNTILTTIVSAAVAIILTLSLAALTNDAYNASSHLFANWFFGSKSDGFLVLKYGSASFFLLVSFWCSSMALGCLIDANFLVNSPLMAGGEFSVSSGHTEWVVEKGLILAVMGNRMLCLAFLLLLWLMGPVPVSLASVALIFGLYEIDFGGRFCSK
ncbi:hypothetical protein NMG60_11035916 [Bertholletia excelsa]